MAAPTNTYKTTDVVGTREDLTDLITNISPNDTMFYRGCGKAKATQKTHEWQLDTLATPASNAQAEGNDPTATAITPTTRKSNTCQIQSKTFIISESTEASNQAGRSSEIGYQTAKHGKELAGDIEYAFLRAVESTTDPRQMKGALNWITTNLDKASDATLNSDGTVSGGTARTLTQTILNENIQDIFTSGGNPTVIYGGAWQCGVISGWANSGTYRRIVESNKLENAVEVYQSPLGNTVLRIVPHRTMPTDVLFLCSPEYWKKATMRPVKRDKLAKTGDNRKYMIVCEHTLEARAEAANGRITNLSTS